MVRREYDIEDMEEKSIVFEMPRRKDILVVLDEMIENAGIYGWAYIFEDDYFYIEYKDGSTYVASCTSDDGIYRRKGIGRIIYSNANDTQVFGDYEVNEWGVVY